MTTGRLHFRAARYFWPSASGQIRWELPKVFLTVLSFLAKTSCES